MRVGTCTKSITPVRTEARYRCLPVGDFNEGTVSEVFWVVLSEVSCFRSSKPMRKSMLKNAAKTGVEVASDVIDGRSLSDSVKNRVPTGIIRGVEEIAFQSTLAKRRRPTPRRRRRRRDIFS